MRSSTLILFHNQRKIWRCFSLECFKVWKPFLILNIVLILVELTYWVFLSYTTISKHLREKSSRKIYYARFIDSQGTIYGGARYNNPSSPMGQGVVGERHNIVVALSLWLHNSGHTIELGSSTMMSWGPAVHLVGGHIFIFWKQTYKNDS